MSTSSVTMSGSSWWICFSASYPFRAVPTIVNSPDFAIVCEINRRMKALSSTTSTRVSSEDTGPPPQRANLDTPVIGEHRDAAAVIQSGILGDDRNVRRAEHVAHGGHVALADVHAAAGEQGSEHARAAND